MNGHIGLIHSILPTTVDLHVTIPESHPSARNLGTERVGSGTIVDPDGYILTVHYVTIGASEITVTMTDGEQYPGQIAAQDQETGLSLVKIAARDLPCLRVAAPDSATLGEAVIMVASSGESSRRVSGGYISSLESYDGQWEYMIDKTIRVTAFNPGFGGGTLANFRAELLGVVSLNLSDVGKFSLAIPIDYYRTYERELKQYGQVRSRPQRPWLGIYPQAMAGHVVIGGVVPNGPAAKFGLQQGDIVLTVEKKAIRTRQELYQEMWKKRPGERISLRILRDDQSFDVEIIGGDRADRYRS
ncbi:MAG TPA: trypsin-like peptidase domain-containing protein [Candidatus Binatia bacterium]|nr:trypsin-like peptidase domain-containing protein [Candidatus Binatia bacterium]